MIEQNDRFSHHFLADFQRPAVQDRVRLPVGHVPDRLDGAQHKGFDAVTIERKILKLHLVQFL